MQFASELLPLPLLLPPSWPLVAASDNRRAGERLGENCRRAMRILLI